MTISAPSTFALEIHPHSSTHWVATYYLMVVTPVGHWADVTWELHRCMIPVADDAWEPVRWLEVRSPEADHPCYAGHRAWATQLAAGYAAALAVYDAEGTEKSLSLREAQHLRSATVVVPVGQLSEWLLDDLEEETSDLRG